MRYTKPPLDFNAQAKLLINRGLTADEPDLETFLGKVNYYRFSGYLYPFRSGLDENYVSGTTFDLVKAIYSFDVGLRSLTLSAIETIDICILRTQMVEKFSLACGAFCYSEHGNFHPSLSITDHQSILTRIEESINHSNEEFVTLYRTKYTSEPYLPFWMVAETVTFGQLSVLFKYLPVNVQVPIAKQFNLHSRDLVSWLHALSTIRNICAHHSRLWNRILPVKPAIPSSKYHPEFHTPARIRNDSYFVVLAMLKYLLDVISPENSIRADFQKLLVQYSDVPIYKMGFPANWQDYPLLK